MIISMQLLQAKDRALEAMEAETRAQAALIQEKQEQLEVTNMLWYLCSCKRGNIHVLTQLKERVVQANLKCVKAMEEEMQAKDQIIQAKEMEVSAKSKVVEHLSEELAAMRLEVKQLQVCIVKFLNICDTYLIHFAYIVTSLWLGTVVSE